MAKKKMIVEEAEVKEVETAEATEATEVVEKAEPSMGELVMNVLNIARDEDTTTEIWNGIEIEIKHSLNIYEMKLLFDYVVERCFSSDDGSYQPEYRDFAERASTIAVYTNIELPASVEDQYDLMYKTDIYSAVYKNINSEQHYAILDAVDEKLKELVDGEAKNAKKVIEMMTELTGGLKDAFDGVDASDINAMVKNIAENGIDEKAIVDAVIKR